MEQVFFFCVKKVWYIPSPKMSVSFSIKRAFLLTAAAMICARKNKGQPLIVLKAFLPSCHKVKFGFDILGKEVPNLYDPYISHTVLYK